MGITKNITPKNCEVLLPILTNLSTDYRCFKIATSLIKMGYKPIVLCDKPKTPLGPLWESIEIEILTRTSHLDHFVKSFLIFQWKLFWYLWKTPSALWISEDCPPLLTCAVVGKLRGRQVIYDSHEIYLGIPANVRSPVRKVFWTLWHNFGFVLVNKVITVSPNFIKHFKTAFPKKNYFSLPNVPLNSIEYTSPPPIGSTVKLIFQGYIRHNSNLTFLLEAMGQLKNVSLTIVGDGEAKEYLKNIISKLSLHDRVTFLPLVPFEKLMETIQQCHIGINIQQHESLGYQLTLGNKIFDYLHAGLPSLLGNTEAISDLLKENPIGVQVDGTSATQIRKGLENLISQYDTFKKNCKTHRQNFIWENFQLDLQQFLIATSKQQ